MRRMRVLRVRMLRVLSMLPPSPLLLLLWHHEMLLLLLRHEMHLLLLRVHHHRHVHHPRRRWLWELLHDVLYRRRRRCHPLVTCLSVVCCASSIPVCVHTGLHR